MPCISFYRFYFKLVVVVEGGLACAQVSIRQPNQRLGGGESMCSNGLSRCHANGDKFKGMKQPVDNRQLVKNLCTGLSAVGSAVGSGWLHQGRLAGCQRLSSKALLMTLTELNAMAAPATMGFSNPSAASGMPATL